MLKQFRHFLLRKDTVSKKFANTRSRWEGRHANFDPCNRIFSQNEKFHETFSYAAKVESLRRKKKLEILVTLFP